MCWLYLVHDMSDAPVPSDLSSTLVIQDDNDFFHVMSNITSNFHLIARSISDSIPMSGDIIFSTDMYKEGSIKQMERHMVGTSDTLIISGPPIAKKPADWKTFLMNSENKSQLVDVMNDVWCCPSW